MRLTAQRHGARRLVALSTDRSRLALGLCLVIAVYIATASYAALTLPLPGTADAMDHLDYIYQVSLGQIPEPYGFELVPGRGGRQFASAHPPIYYWLMSLIVGPLLPDHLDQAIAIIRTINIGLGVLTIVSIAWFGYQFGGRYRVALGVGMAAIAASSFTMIRFGAEVYNDMLIALVSTVAIMTAARIVVTGRWSWVTGSLLVLSTVIGLGTKVTFIVTLAIVAGGIGLSGIVRVVQRHRRQGFTMIAAAFAVPLVSVVSNAWFYLINLERSGSLYRSVPKLPLQGRPERSTSDAISDPEFWLVIARGFIGRASGDFSRFAATMGTILIIVLLIVSVTLAALMWRRHQVRIGRHRWVVVLMLALTVIGSQATQLSHATGFGAYNFRYFMPAMIGIAFFLSIGFAMARPVGLLLLTSVATFFAASNAFSCTLYAMSQLKIPAFSPGIPLLIAQKNGIAPSVIVVCVVAACVTSILLLAFTPRIQGASTRVAPSTTERSSLS